MDTTRVTFDTARVTFDTMLPEIQYFLQYAEFYPPKRVNEEKKNTLRQPLKYEEFFSIHIFAIILFIFVCVLTCIDKALRW